MKILVATIAFGITMGGLFLFGTSGTQKKSGNTENYAQIIKELSNQNQSKAPTSKPINKFSKVPTKSPTGSPASSFTSTPAVTTQPSPSSLLTTTSLPIPIQSPTPTSSGQTTPTPTLTPTPQPSQQSNQITIISLTSPVKQNSTAQLSISTQPNAQCSIKITLPSGSQSTAKGLEIKTSDALGNITWSWKINWNTTPGTANIDITCSRDGQNFSKSLQMEIIER